jgi:5-methylcytosine-specific restriction endonuclease McrA
VGGAYDAAWRRVRLVVLERDEHRCRWCGAEATTVDHVRALADGGARLDPDNLAASCGACNYARGARVANRRRRARGRARSGLTAGTGWSAS